jgi:hypothetical protein
MCREHPNREHSDRGMFSLTRSSQGEHGLENGSPGHGEHSEEIQEAGHGSRTSRSGPTVVSQRVRRAMSTAVSDRVMAAAFDIAANRDAEAQVIAGVTDIAKLSPRRFALSQRRFTLSPRRFALSPRRSEPLTPCDGRFDDIAPVSTSWGVLISDVLGATRPRGSEPLTLSSFLVSGDSDSCSLPNPQVLSHSLPPSASLFRPFGSLYPFIPSSIHLSSLFLISPQSQSLIPSLFTPVLPLRSPRCTCAHVNAHEGARAYARAHAEIQAHDRIQSSHSSRGLSKYTLRPCE